MYDSDSDMNIIYLYNGQYLIGYGNFHLFLHLMI